MYYRFRIALVQSTSAHDHRDTWHPRTYGRSKAPEVPSLSLNNAERRHALASVWGEGEGCTTVAPGASQCQLG
jgi:hypothetical protein